MAKNDSGGNTSMVFMGMGFELVIMVLGGAYFGQFIDKKLGWNGYATATMIVALLVSWFYHLLVLLKRVNEDESDDGT